MYEPTPVPSDSPRGLRAWLAHQLREVASVLARPTVVGVRFALLAAEPARYENGDVVGADGTNWNPGGGAGIYARISGAWVKL
jgi:hypothetical protein